MSLINDFISGTQSLGKLSIMLTIFGSVIIVLITGYFLFQAIFNYPTAPPQPCKKDENGKLPENCSDLNRTQTIILLSLVILFFIVTIIVSYMYRNNKAFQTLEGAKFEVNSIAGLFK